MKKIFITLCILLLINTLISAQTTTIILFRHAEKDTFAVGGSMKSDPPLSAEGLRRADRIPGVLIAYQPDSIYSTDYTRTKSTIAPLAKKFNLGVHVYDPRSLSVFADRLLQAKGKVLVVAGHSNTTPALVNLLIKQNKYTSLDESVYNQFWIVTISGDGKVEDRVVTY